MKKAFNFRSAIVCVLVLIMCLTAFVACDKNKGDQGQTDPLQGLNKARDYVKQLYINNNEETAADYTVVSKVKIDGVTYPVSWTVTIKTEGASVDDVKVVAGESNVTIDVIDMADNDIEYTLTATVTDANGNTATVDFKRKVPKFHVATWAEYAEAADGKLLVVDGIVTMFTSVKDGAKSNSMYIQDNDGAYYAYSMDEDPKDKNIAVGMKVRLAGTKKNYNGTYELEKVLIKEVLSTEIVTIEPMDVTELLKSAESVKAKSLTDLQGRMVTVKGAIAVEVDTENKYCYFSIGGIKAYIRPSASAGFLNNTEISKFIEDFTKNKGHLVDVTGQAVVYSGAFYMQPVKTDAVVYGEVADLEPAEQVKFVKENANALKDVTYSGYTVTLPSASDVFTDVKIAWTVDNTDVCKIENGVAKFTYDYATAGRTVKLTATYTHATDTTVAPLTNEYTLELLIPQDATVEEFLAKDEDDKVYIITGYIVADGSSSGTGSFVVADATGAVFSYNKADVAVGDKVKVYGTRASNYGVPQIGTLNVVKVDAEGETYTYPEPAVIDGTTLDLSTLTATTIVPYTGVYTKITGLTFYKDGNYNSAGLLKEGATVGSTAKADYTQVLSLYSASDAIPEEWAGKPVVVYGYVRGYSTKKYLTIQVAKVEIGYDDTAKVAQAKEALTENVIGGTEFAENFDLPATGLWNTTISWAVKGESSVLAIDGIHATVTKPQNENGEQVTIVATIKSGEVTDTKEFTITILGEVPSYAVNWTDANLTAVYGDDNTALVAGGEVKKGTVVTFTVALPANKVVASVTANGEAVADVAYKTTFTVTVNDTTAIVVNYADYSLSTVASIIASNDTNALYQITGYVVAFGADAGKEGAYAIADESGVAMSFVKAALAVGDYVTVYATKSVDKYGFVSIGVKYVEKLEGGNYVEPSATTIEVKDVDYSIKGSYVGTFYKAVNGTVVVDSNGYVNLVAENGKKLSLYCGDTMKEELKALAGQELEVYCVSRSTNATVGYWGVQVARYTVVDDAAKVVKAANALALASTTLGAGELTLPATGLYDATITWASDNAAIVIGADGITATIGTVSEDTTVTLTATITLNDASTTKDITVTVSATTPEYTVSFANVDGATVSVTVDGVAIATGAKVEQGKVLTITVTVDTANYELVSVMAGATTLEAVEGVYTHQVAGDVEIVVTVKELLNTPEKIVNAAYELAQGESLGTQTLTGVITKINDAYSSTYKNITVTIQVGDLADKPIQCFRMVGDGAENLAVGDKIVVTGTLKNFKGTIEFDAKCTFTAYEPTDAEKVEEAAADLALANTTLGAGEITLPATGINGTTITWASDNAAIVIGTDGITATIATVTEDTTVTLTATITLNDASTTKDITVTVTAKTPEYTVTFTDSEDVIFEVKNGETTLTSGDKVEQGTTITITVVFDEANYMLVAVKAGETVLTATEGVYTFEVLGDVEITAELKSLKGLSAEKAYSVAEIVEATSGLVTDEVTSDILYVKGVVKSFTAGNFVQNLILADENDNTKTFLVYSVSYGTAEDSVKAIYVGDTVVVAGYVKNYSGTIEMATANNVYVQFISRTAGQGSIVIGETGNATVTVDNGQTTGDNGTTFTFEVAVATGYEIVAVRVNGNKVEAVEGKYTGTIADVTTITVETKAEGEVVAESETLAVPSTKGTLSGKTITWTATSFTVTGRQASSKTAIRTKDSDHYRVYQDSELEIAGNNGKKITKVIVTCSSDAYATVLQGSLTTTGATATVSGSVVTVTVDEGSLDSISFTATAQTRITQVEVYTL